MCFTKNEKMKVPTKFSCTLTKDQYLNCMLLPPALQKVYAAQIAKVDLRTEFTFTLLDMIEILQEFQTHTHRAEQLTELNTAMLLNLQGSVNMVPYEHEYGH